AGIQSSGLKPRTSPTIRQSGGSFDASKSVGVLMPARPRSAAAQNFSTPKPMGETMPSPVMTGWRFIGWLSPRRGAAFPPKIPGFTLAGAPVDEQVPASRLLEEVNQPGMSRQGIYRRQFFTPPLALLLAPLALAL